MESNSPWGSALLNQLTARSEAAPTRQHFNPRPPGILQAGSATQAVNAFFESQPDRFFTCAQIIRATGRTDKSVDWALRMLRSLGRLEMRPDDGRNDHYLKYRFKPEVIRKGGQP